MAALAIIDFMQAHGPMTSESVYFCFLDMEYSISEQQVGDIIAALERVGVLEVRLMLVAWTTDGRPASVYGLKGCESPEREWQSQRLTLPHTAEKRLSTSTLDDTSTQSVSQP